MRKQHTTKTVRICATCFFGIHSEAKINSAGARCTRIVHSARSYMMPGGICEFIHSLGLARSRACNIDETKLKTENNVATFFDWTTKIWQDVSHSLHWNGCAKAKKKKKLMNEKRKKNCNLFVVRTFVCLAIMCSKLLLSHVVLVGTIGMLFNWNKMLDTTNCDFPTQWNSDRCAYSWFSLLLHLLSLATIVATITVTDCACHREIQKSSASIRIWNFLFIFILRVSIFKLK